MTIIRVRKGGFDEYADRMAGVSRESLDDAFTAPRVSNDISDRGRAGVIVGLSLFAPYGTDLVHTDQIEVDGVLYEVDGDPGQWHNPFTGTDAGCEVALKRAAG